MSNLRVDVRASGLKSGPSLRYVLVTAARNEAAFIDKTMRSVISQTVLPLKWIIVSDGSTDETDAIVADLCLQHEWIELVRLPQRAVRDFAGKVRAFNQGYARLRGLDYDAIGSLDADVSFDREYFSFLIDRLSENPSLGLVGTPFEENGVSYDYRFVSIEHVSGACQLFRRECFEAVGGYVAMPGGGVDHVAVITARMKGWKTRSFPEKTCCHHRKIGSASRGVLKARFHVGRLDYALGSHPLWEVFRTAYQMSQRPYVVGGCMIFAGYFSSFVRRVKRPIPSELVVFRRREQMARLKRFFRGNVAQHGNSSASPSPPIPQSEAPLQ